MSVFLLCEQAIGLVRGKRLILSAAERTMLENLNYEGLTAAHAQDEAVVCALHFARVRDRLLQSYAWTFAKKSATLANGATLPGDYLSMLYVLVNGDPVDYEVNGSYINVKSSSEIHYIAKITDTTKWASIFSDVFCYSLAIEICTAVTGKPEYTQVLEQKAQELIHRAFQIGAIKAETHITLTQEIYNRAISLARGQRTVAPTSTTATEQGIDNYGIPNDRIQAEIQACKRASDTTRDRLLSLHAWTFARKSAKLSNAVSAVDGWNYGYSLPTDCLKVLTVLSNGEPVDFEEVGTVLYCKVTTPTIRYTAKMTDMSSWSGAFTDVFVSSLAQEIVLATTHNLDTVQLLEQKTQILIRNAEKLGAIKAEVKIPVTHDLYQRAISLARGQRIISPTSNTATEQGVDITADINFREREAIATCKNSSSYVRDKVLQLYAWAFARKTATLGASTTVSGWNYGYSLPSDCLTVLTVLSNGEPVDFEVVGSKLYSNGAGVEVRYTARISDMTQWPSSFANVFCYELAQEIILATTHNLEATQLLEQKARIILREAEKIGAIKAEVKIPASQEIFNRAISLVRGQRTISPTGNASVEQGIDITADINFREREAIAVCRRSLPELRDKLLKLYAWKFARKTATLTATAKISGWNYAYKMPSDCLKILAVLNGDELIDHEETDGVILCNSSGNITVRYTKAITDLTALDAVFKDVLCYELAQEIASAITWNSELITLLEQKKNLIIQTAHRTGLIQEETLITVKEDLYNRAILLSRGQRSIKTTGQTAIEQGIDNYGHPNDRTQTENAICKKSTPFIRDKLLQMYSWTFARKTATLENTTTISGWSYGYKLPSDCVTVLTVLSDGEPIDWEVANGCIYCNGTNASVRYTAQITDFNKWSSSFANVFCYELAQEIISATTANPEQVTLLEQKKQALIADAHKIGAIKIETRIPVKQELFNRAIGLVKGQKNGEQPDFMNNRYEDEIAACKRAFNSIRDRLLQSYAWIFARKTETPARLAEGTPGWRYTYLLPDDCLRVVAVIAPDRQAEYANPCDCREGFEYPDSVELADYETNGSELYTNSEVVYIRYTARVDDISQWVASFTDAFVIMLAVEVCLNVTDDKPRVQLLEQRLLKIIDDAKENKLIYVDTGLPKKRQTRRSLAREVPYMDYSGIPTLACSPLGYCGRGF